MTKFNDIPRDMGKIVADHIALYLSDPVKAHLWDSSVVGTPDIVTTLLLTTTGRKSGQPRHVPLLYVNNDGSYLVVGSKGGLPGDPIWYLNLQENPECDIRVADFHSQARASTLTGPARDHAWSKITDRHKVYLKYQARADRAIPVVLLQPFGPAL